MGTGLFRRCGTRSSVGGFLAVAFTIGVTACGGGGGGGGSADAAAGPALRFSTGQAAAVVIGQSDAKSGTGATTQAGMSFPFDVASDNGTLFVADLANQRVLGFNAIPGADGANASFVLGQSAFTTKVSGSGLDQMSAPSGLAADGGQLFVADRSNARILVFKPVPTEADSAPVVAAPAASFAITGVGTGGFSLPYDVAAGGGKLVISDANNNRVLIWNSVPTTDVQPDLVLGQPDLSTTTYNTGGVSAASMYHPMGVWTDGKRLLVSDAFNQRVLIWNTFPTTDTQPADLVLGQTDFKTGTLAATVSAATFESPCGVFVKGDQIFLGDASHRRVLVWNFWPGHNGQAADVVLGQPTGDAVDVTGPSASLLTNASGVYLVGTQLFVADAASNRVVVFNAQ